MKLKASSGWYWELGCLLVFLLLSGIQLFLRPITGLADNGDFPKVLGPRNVCDPDHGRDAYKYIYSTYIIDFSCRWNNGIISSEQLFVRAIKRVALWEGRKTFPITWAAVAHLPLLLASLSILLWALHNVSPALRFGIPSLAILIFSDVAWVSSLNSFYMDTASMIFLLLTVSLSCAWLLRPGTWVPAAFALAAILLAFSKTQHVPVALLFVPLAAWFAAQNFRLRRSLSRSGWWWTAAAASILLADITAIRTAPPLVHADPIFNLVYFRLLPESPHPLEILKQFDLPESTRAYSGLNAYNPNSPMADPDWRADFARRTSFSRIVVFYVRNPRLLLRQLQQGLLDSAEIRPAYLANYRREDGFPPTTLARRFDTWSNLRSRLFRIFPLHILILYMGMALVALACVFSQTWAARWPAYPLVLVLTAGGAIEFLLAVSFDVLETPRHLFLFHLSTDILVLFAAAGMLTLVQGESAPTPTVSHRPRI